MKREWESIPACLKTLYNQNFKNIVKSQRAHEKITQGFWAWPLCNFTRFSKHFFMFFCSGFLNEFMKLFWFWFLFQLPGMNSVPLTNLKTLTSCQVWSPLKRQSSKLCSTWDCSLVNEVIKYRRERAPMHFCCQVRNQNTFIQNSELFSFSSHLYKIGTQSLSITSLTKQWDWTKMKFHCRFCHFYYSVFKKRKFDFA